MSITLLLFLVFAALLFLTRKKRLTPLQHVSSKLDANTMEFYEWAFGKEWNMNTPLSKAFLIWNERHPEMPIDPEGWGFEDIDRMVALWQKENHGQDHLVPPDKDCQRRE